MTIAALSGLASNMALTIPLALIIVFGTFGWTTESWLIASGRSRPRRPQDRERARRQRARDRERRAAALDRRDATQTTEGAGS